jgi:ATP-dependent protease ClpP protease subunit
MKTKTLKNSHGGQWYSIKNQDEETPQIYIYDVIGEDFWTGGGVTAKDFANAINAIKSAKLDIHINSPGGDVFEALAIHNAILNHPAEVTVYIDGLAASAASFIALAGDKVVMADNAYFMIHDPWGGFIGNADEFREYAAFLDEQKANLVNIYEKHSNLSQDEISQKMSDETWMNAEECLTADFIDEISTGKKSSASVNGKALSAIFNKIPESLLAEVCQCQNTSKTEKKEPETDPKAEENDDWTLEIALARQKQVEFLI